MEIRIAGGGRFLLPACVCGETGGEGKYFMCGNGLVGIERGSLVQEVVGANPI